MFVSLDEAALCFKAKQRRLVHGKEWHTILIKKKNSLEMSVCVAAVHMSSTLTLFFKFCKLSELDAWKCHCRLLNYQVFSCDLMQRAQSTSDGWKAALFKYGNPLYPFTKLLVFYLIILLVLNRFYLLLRRKNLVPTCSLFQVNKPLC